jgi:hypothetical protein
MRTCWLQEEVDYLLNNHKTLSIDEIAKNLSRSVSGVQNKIVKLNLKRFASRFWTEEEVFYLEEAWGHVGYPTIAKKLNKSISAIKQKAKRLGLREFLSSSGEYITYNQLMRALGKTNAGGYNRISWEQKRGMPIKYKKIYAKKYKVVYLNDFWKWAKENIHFVDFSKFEKGILGKEPDWVAEKRKADILFSQYKKTPWTKDEDALLESLLNLYKYSYRDLSIRLKRTEGAIKRRMNDLNLKARPLKADNHNPWSQEEETILYDMFEKGYKAEIIAERINRSALAINGKLEREYKNLIRTLILLFHFTGKSESEYQNVV